MHRVPNEKARITITRNMNDGKIILTTCHYPQKNVDRHVDEIVDNVNK
ncbi:MAG: hypothetical protein K0R93_1526 [Anaerosolibacter sp.]|nr:hypothetical protein [Anaerosolibacter sp.]